MAIVDKVFRYTKPDVSIRQVKEAGGTHVVTNQNGLYNQNLTVDELCLLRNLIWDYKEYIKSHPNKHGNHDGWDERHFTEFVHSWMFTDKKNVTLYSDIILDIEDGVKFEGQLP